MRDGHYIKKVKRSSQHVPFWRRDFIRNPVFWCIQVVKLFVIIVIYGCGAYMPKIMEIQFNTDPTTAGISLGKNSIFN